METVALPWAAPATTPSLIESLTRRRTAVTDSHRLIMAARVRALLEDFGPSGFRRRLDVLIDDLNRRPGGSEVRRTVALIERWLVELLMRRARLIDSAKKRPALAELDVSRPIFVTGVPGAPIDAACRMLAERHRALRPDRGVDACVLTPGFGVSFAGFGFATVLGVERPPIAPGDVEEIYEIHRLQAALVSAESSDPDGPSRWLFTGTDHLIHHDAIASAYPDAIAVVVPVADNAAVLASVGAEASAAARIEMPFDEAASVGRWTEAVVNARVELDRLRARGSIETIDVDATGALDRVLSD